jgi:hypothetical protein
MTRGLKWDELTPQERLIAEQAIENFRTLNKTCDEAGDGTVLATAETLAMQQGRQLTRRTLEASLSRQAREAEKKGRRDGRAPAADDAPTAGAKRAR